MVIEGIRTLDGPNVYHYKPVLVMSLRLQELTDRESCQVPGFMGRLLDCLPGLNEHHCSRKRAGGFVERLREGTYFGHIVEHVTLELAGLLGSPVTFGKTRYAGEPGLYHVIVRYRAEVVMRYLLEVAVALVEALVRGEPFDLESRLEEGKELAVETELGPSTRSIVEAADSRGIPWRRLNRASLIQLGYGKHRRFIQAALTGQTSHVAVEIASDKELTKELLRQALVPVPRGVVVSNAEQALAAFSELGGPGVVKPLDGNQGKGVSLNLITPDQVTQAFEIAVQYSERVIIEEQYHGRNYRVLVVGGKMVAASERLASHVVGDGEHSLNQLIDLMNQDPMRGDGHEKPMTKIVLDEVAHAYLKSCGRSPEYVPGAGEAVVLRQSANLSTGGTAVDVTEAVHPATRRICERAAQAIGLDVCGVDLVTPDIAQPLSGGIIEVNAAPGLRMHLYPSMGSRRDVGAEVVDMLYPTGSPSRIPICSITGTNGKTTVTRMVGHVLGQQGLNVGMATTDGVYVSGECIASGDMTGPKSARSILSDPTVEVAVLETARGGILRRGLGYDWSDVAIITNIRGDHIGQDGIQDVEDLVWIKSLVAERVREGGTLVLNADDTEAVRLAASERVNRVPKAIVYFSVRHRNPVIRRHVTTGGTAYFQRDDQIIEARGGNESEIVKVSAIPVTLGGAALFQVSNCLATVAASRVLGCSARLIARALSSFESSTHNPGRVELYQLGRGLVMVDYGHNPDAFRATSRMAALLDRRLIGIIAVPGDRDDSVIVEAARVAARGFHKIVIREDRDLRGRKQGEVAELLWRTLRVEAPGAKCKVVLDELEALAEVLPEVAAGAMALHFYEHLEPVLHLLAKAGARPVKAKDLIASPIVVGAPRAHAPFDS
jgi:cyanophycin synthetase